MTVKTYTGAVLPGEMVASEVRSLASGSVVATYRLKNLGWLIQNKGNVTLPFQRRDGSVVHIQPGEEAEV